MEQNVIYHVMAEALHLTPALSPEGGEGVSSQEQTRK
jgi:hypothetical protein